MTDLKCSEFGCTMPSDTCRCPNCGHRYDDVITKVPTKINGNGITFNWRRASED